MENCQRENGLLQVGRHASRLAYPGKAYVKKMPEIYGLKQSELFEELDPLPVFLRMFLNRLNIWMGKYYPRLKILVTKRLRYVYMLKPSELTIEEGACGLLPTPTASMGNHGWGIGNPKKKRYRAEMMRNALALSGGWTPSVPQVEAMMGMPVGWVSGLSVTQLSLSARK
jgi:hypothetical protein